MVILWDYTYSNKVAFVLKISSFTIGFRSMFCPRLDPFKRGLIFGNCLCQTAAEDTPGPPSKLFLGPALECGERTQQRQWDTVSVCTWLGCKGLHPISLGDLSLLALRKWAASPGTEGSLYLGPLKKHKPWISSPRRLECCQPLREPCSKSFPSHAFRRDLNPNLAAL